MENHGMLTRLIARCFGGATAVSVLVLAGLALLGGTWGYAAPELLVLQLLPPAGLVTLPLIALGDKLSRRCGFGESLGRTAKDFAHGALLGAAMLAVALALLAAADAIHNALFATAG